MTTFVIIAPINLGLVAATGIPPGDVMIALAFAVAATAVAATGVPLGDFMMVLALMATAAVAVASMFEGGRGRVGVCNIIALLRESLV